MRVLALVAVAAAASVGAEARLRGSRSELQDAISGASAFVEVNQALQAKAPASKVLLLLENMMKETRAAQKEDDARFEEMKKSCAATAGGVQAKADEAARELRQAESEVAAASRKIEEMHHSIVTATQREEDESDAIVRLDRRIASLRSTQRESRAAFLTSDGSYDEAIHAIDAIIAHLNAGSGLDEASLLEVERVVHTRGASLSHEHATALKAAAASAGDEAAASAAEEAEETEAAVAEAGAEEGSEAAAPSATGVSGDITVRIVDMIMSLRKSFREQRRRGKALFAESKKQFESELADMEAKRAAHVSARDAAVQERKDSKAARAEAASRRTSLNDRIADLHSRSAKKTKEAREAGKQCETYARQFEERRKSRAKDLEAASALYNLIMEKQRAIREKFEQLERLSDGAPQGDSPSDFAEAAGVPAKKVERALEVPAEDEIRQTQAAIKDQARQLEMEAPPLTTGSTGATGAAGTSTFGNARGGDF